MAELQGVHRRQRNSRLGTGLRLAQIVPMRPDFFKGYGVLLDQFRRRLRKEREAKGGLVYLLAARQPDGHLWRMMPPLGFGIEAVLMLFVIGSTTGAHTFGLERLQQHFFRKTGCG